MAVQTPDQMGTLGKIGFVLSSFANPQLPMQYQKALQDQKMDELNMQNVQSQIEQRRQAFEEARQQRARQEKARQALGSILSRGMMPNVQGAPNPQALGTITPQQIGQLYAQGADLGELSALQGMLNPEQNLVEVFDPSTGMMIRVPESQAIGRPSQAPSQKDRRIVEQDGVQYYADTGEPVIASPITQKKPEKGTVISGLSIAEGAQPTAEDAKIVKTSLQAKKSLDTLTKELVSLVDKYGYEAKGSKDAKMIDQKIAQISLQMKNLEELGALQEADRAILNDMIGTPVRGFFSQINPYERITAKGTALKQLADFTDYLNDRFNNTLSTRGYVIDSSADLKNKYGLE